MFNNTNNTFFTGTENVNYWNTTNQTGTRIHSAGINIGGNYWTNSSGTGFSDTCADSNIDGFCDSTYNVTADAVCGGGNCGSNVDYLVLAPPDITPPVIFLPLYTNTTLKKKTQI